jgi:hypothetical protein
VLIPSLPVSVPTTPLEAVRRFAESTYLTDCLREVAAMPSGFYIELPTTPIDVCGECPSTSNRILSWQILAALSGQWDADHCRVLPADSMWRRMRLCEGGLSPDAIALMMQDQLLVDLGRPGVTGTEELGWGPAINTGWVVRLLTDSNCAVALSGLMTHFSKPKGAV